MHVRIEKQRSRLTKFKGPMTEYTTANDVLLADLIIHHQHAFLLHEVTGQEAGRWSQVFLVI